MIEVYDNLFSKEEINILDSYMNSLAFKNHELDSEEIPEHVTLSSNLEENNQYVKLIISKISNKIELSKYRLIRVYCNAFKSNDCPSAHIDTNNSNDRTILYYPMKSWNYNLGGETVFYNSEGDITHSIIPKPGRIIIFSSNILHSARPPYSNFFGLRLSVAFKYEYSPNTLIEF